MTVSDPDLDLAVLARLERIEALDRRGVSSAELLPELRSLLSDAERGSQTGGGVERAGGEGRSGEEVVGRPGTALQRT